VKDFQRETALCELRNDVLALTLSFLDVPALATACLPCRQLREIAASHEHWHWFVLQFFGVYYDDYMRSVEVCDAYRWRRLFVYIRQVHHNVDRRRGVRCSLPQLLRPCVWLNNSHGDTSGDHGDVGEVDDAHGHSRASSASASGSSRRRRRYRGSLELADNCKVFFWENGRTVQVVRAHDGHILREIDTGQTFRRYFHRLADVRNRLFVCLNDCIKAWEYGVNDAHKPPVQLPQPRRPPTLAKIGRPLELLVHRRRLILLESNCCLLWDTDTLDFVCCIQHEGGGDFSGVGGGGSSSSSSSSSSSAVPAELLNQAEEPRSLEVQWMGDLIVTWVRSGSQALKIWTLEGRQEAQLATESPLVQVDVARVTWASLKALDHFILSALDARSVISLWDSKNNFSLIFRFYCGCEEPFDLVLTQDFMAVVNDNMAENRLELCFWRLWMHPDFSEAEDAAGPRHRTEAAAIAARQREATLQPGSSPAGARFSMALPTLPPGAAVAATGAAAVAAAAAAMVFGAAAAAAAGGAADGGAPVGHGAAVAAAVAHVGGEALQRFLHRELRPNARLIRKLLIPDIDSYFASYRNFLNVCSFHKSGQESLSVYRSSSLQKKVFFPPAKHTKFEEWLALQVQNDGTVAIYDFRPNQMAFDELPVPGQKGDLGSGGLGAETSEDARESPPVPRTPVRASVAGGSRRARRA